METIDLRSDTVTTPTPEMREAMAAAEVGDDVYGEDPTVNRLQDLAAERTGKEAGLLVSSGTMGNLIGVLGHCERGDEVIMGNLAHTFLFEAGGISALGGVFPHTLPNQPDGTLKLEDIRSAIRGDDVHFPISKLLVLENTQNRCGGAVLSPEYTRQAVDLAHRHNLAVHLDGARVFNAAAALGVDVKELTGPVDSVTFCLSKALCAPVGSVLCGTKVFIHKARRLRKQLGGGTRQAGVLAAAGIIAIETMSKRLGEDHLRARRLAEGIANISGFILPFGLPPSNMVFVEMAPSVKFSAHEVVQKLTEDGIKIGITGERRFRMVTHYWIDDAAVERTIKAFARLAG